MSCCKENVKLLILQVEYGFGKNHEFEHWGVGSGQGNMPLVPALIISLLDGPGQGAFPLFHQV